MNYNSWKPKNWETDLPESNDLFFEYLSDSEKGLVITLSNNKDHKFEIIFDNYPAYRNILEEYRLNLWAIKDERWSDLGSTWTVDNSDWLEQLQKDEPLIVHHEKQLKHYIIITQSAVIEILSSDNNPIIKTVHNKM